LQALIPCSLIESGRPPPSRHQDTASALNEKKLQQASCIVVRERDPRRRRVVPMFPNVE
jgi:hypothetical protein